MNLLHRLQLRDYLFWAVVLGLISLSAFMVLPFVGAIISTYLLSYLVRPLFLKLKGRFGNSLAALFCIITTIILIVVPISLISLQILDQVGGISKSLDVFLAQPFLKSSNIDAIGLKAWVVLTTNNIVNSTVQSIPSFALGLVITLNGMYYLLCNWDELSSHLKKYLPFKNKDKMVIQLGATTDAIIHGHVLISVLEGAIAFVGFSLLGVQASLILAILIFILAFVPSIGPLLVWVPLALYYFSIHQYATMWGVVVTGLILLVGVEFLFYTRYVGSKSRIHPFVMLIGVFGGIIVFGIFGFIIGPLLLATSIRIIESSIGSSPKSKKRAPSSKVALTAKSTTWPFSLPRFQIFHRSR